MAQKKPSPIHSAGPRPDNKPRIYNRPWHLDADDRRHHGRRKWDPDAVEAFISLASQFNPFYPPDFSARDTIRFRSPGLPKPIAELRTSNPASLVLLLHPQTGTTIGELRRSLRLPIKRIPARKRIAIQITSRSHIESPRFIHFFTEYLKTLQLT